jgi:hypothetical protein
MKHSKKVSIIISSCDAYSDVWEPFFRLFKKYWKPLEYPIIFNTETKKVNSADLDLITINSNYDWSWSKRLRNVIKKVDSPYIILLLDDFFIYDNVSTDRIEECVKMMSKDKRIANITFFKTGTDGIILKSNPAFSAKRRKSLYKVNAVAGLWRKKKLLKYLKDDENAWEFEQNGTERSWRSLDKFYYLSDIDDRIIPYDFTKYGLFNGKWLKPTISLFENEKINIDYSERGIYENYERALSKSIYGILKLDSKLEIDNEGKIITKYYTNRPPIEQVEQIYKLRRTRSNTIIWWPSSNYGYALINLRITLRLSDGSKKIVDKDTLKGNYKFYKEMLWFLYPNPSIIIQTGGLTINKVIIECQLSKELDSMDLKHVYNKIAI